VYYDCLMKHTNTADIQSSTSKIELSVVIPCHNEADNLQYLIPDLIQSLETAQIVYEIIIIDACTGDGTQELASEYDQVRYYTETSPGYGSAIMKGVSIARAEYILTLDADLSHPASFIEQLWNARVPHGIVVASRYVPGGKADQNPFRLWLSRLLNSFFRIGFKLPYRDMTSGYRIYHHAVFHDIQPKFTNFVILLEILLMAHQQQVRICEIPFHYQPRHTGHSHARILAFGVDYLRLFLHFRTWRNIKK